MIADDRKTIRQNFSMLLTAVIPEAQVFAGQVADFGGQSPVIVVAGSGSNHEQVTPDFFVPTHHIDIFVFVLYSDEQSGWDELDAEDLLDDLEHKIYQVIRTNQKAEHWDCITYRTSSTATPAPSKIGGSEYKVEVISLSFS